MLTVKKLAYVIAVLAVILALFPTTVLAQSFYEDWHTLTGWEVYEGWWGKPGILKLSGKTYMSPPYSLYIKSKISEAAFIFRKIPGIDFDKPYRVSLWIYLADDCDGIKIYQDKNFRLDIRDNALKIHEKIVAGKSGYRHVVNLEKKTWYNIVAEADPREKVVTVTVGGVTVTGKFAEPPLKTSVTDNKGRVREWDVILGDLSHNDGKGEIYIDDLMIAQIGAFDFDISIKPSSVKIEKGEEAAVTIEVSLTSGSSQPVSLSVECPSGLSCSLSRTVVNPPDVSVLTIQAGSTGVFSIVVKGSGGGVEKIATLTLSVEEKEETKTPSFCTQFAIALIIPAALIVYRKRK